MWTGLCVYGDNPVRYTGSREEIDSYLRLKYLEGVFKLLVQDYDYPGDYRISREEMGEFLVPSDIAILADVYEYALNRFVDGVLPRESKKEEDQEFLERLKHFELS